MTSVFDALDREWARLTRDHVAAHRLGAACRAAGGARTLLELERFVRSASPPDADRVLLALARDAAGHGPSHRLAARVLLQMLLPGTRNLARRWWALGDADERAAAAVAAVYQRIRTYPVTNRPGRVAANVLMDAARELRRRVPPAAVVPAADPAGELARADRPAGDRADAGAPTDRSPSFHPAVELTEVLVEAVEAGVLSPPDAELIARSRIAGERMADLATSHGLSARTMWDRRQRAERTLAGAGPGA